MTNDEMKKRIKELEELEERVETLESQQRPRPLEIYHPRIKHDDLRPEEPKCFNGNHPRNTAGVCLLDGGTS